MKKTKEEIIERLNGMNPNDLVPTLTVEKLGEILYELGYDFYIEGLTTNCGDGEMTLQLDYFNVENNIVVCVTDMEYTYCFDTIEDVADYILELEEMVDRNKKKLSRKVYIVAYDNGWETESYYYRDLSKAEAKADELCNNLSIDRNGFLPLNCRQELDEGRIKFEELKFDD